VLGHFEREISEEGMSKIKFKEGGMADNTRKTYY
jgi:hypothetical protein